MDNQERHEREASEMSETAELDVVRSEEVLQEWHATFLQTQEIVRKNGFGAALTKIMRAPARSTR